MGYLLFEYSIYYKNHSKRTAGLEKANIPEESKMKWRKIMNNVFMSSEKSEDEDSSIGSAKILVKKPLTYRSQKVVAFFFFL